MTSLCRAQWMQPRGPGPASAQSHHLTLEKFQGWNLSPSEVSPLHTTNTLPEASFVMWIPEAMKY